MSGPGLEVGTALRLEVSAAVVLGVRLLALPRADLEHELATAAETNPALVVREHPCCARCGRRSPAGVCGRCRAPAAADPPDVAAAVSAWEELRRALLTALPTRLADAGLAVLTALDDRGLLDPHAVAGLPADVLRTVVDALREVGPPGIGAATARESLLVQLDTAPLGAADRALARLVLTEHAALLAAEGPDAVARAVGCPAERVAALLARLGRLLRPYPALATPAVAAPVLPDLLFERDGDRVRAVVPERERWTVGVDERYRRAPASSTLVRDAAAVADQVRRRWSLFARVGELLAHEHAAALLAGSTAFTPLTQDAAARRLGVHPSSVSRVVRHRRARLVDGQVVALGRMFGAHHDARAAVARLAARRPRPSDREIAETLAAQGFVIARRTVAKYRLATPD